MAMTSNEFLKKFFNIHRLNDMQDNDYERWVRFEDFVSKDNMTDNMKKWAGYLKKDPADSTGKTYLRKNGFYEIQDYPDINDLPDEDLEKLFLACQKAFNGLKKNRDAYADTAKVYNFINNFSNIFADTSSSRIALKSTKTAIERLGELLEHIIKKYPDKAPDLGVILRHTGLKTSLPEFIEGIKGEKYNKNDEFQTILKNIAAAFSEYGDGKGKTFLEKLLTDHSADDVLKTLVPFVTTNRIADEYGAWTEASVSDKAKSEFKENYSTIFKELYKEQKVFDAFKQHEGEDKQISDAIEKTKADMDYANPESKDFVAPKREEELTVPQQIQKWASKTYSEYFAKYSKFKGDRIYLDESSGEICKALDKAEIKPTDGLKKILENEKKIKTALQNDVKSRDAFDWLSKTLKELQDDPDTAKAFAGALKNGHQMKSLVKEIIIKAAEADDPKVTAKAKIALEVLSVIKYGNTTSTIMDAIKNDKDLFKLLSNKDLSWNKNAGVAFVTAAMDKTVRAAFLGVSYGATFLWNSARKSGSKFNQKFMDNKNDKTGKRMQQASEAWEADHEAAKKDLIKTNENAKTAKAAQEAKLAKTGIADDADLSVKTTELEQWQDEQNQLESEVAPTRRKINAYSEMLDMLDHFDYLEQQKDYVDSKIAEALSSQQADILNQMYERYEYELEDLKNTVPGYDQKNLRRILETQIDTLSENPIYKDNIIKLNQKSNEVYERQESINKFKKASAEIEALDKTISKNEDKLKKFDEQHANVYDELMAHWDFLETGRDSHTGPLYTRRWGSAKAHQQRLNQKAVDLLNKFSQGYHAA